MNEKINNLIPKALQAIRDCGIEQKLTVKGKDGTEVAKLLVPKEFKGYVASMGASILQAGLMPTLAFYQNDENNKAKSSLLLKAILTLLKDENDKIKDDNLITYVIRKTKGENTASTIKVNTLNSFDLYNIEEEIIAILIALKLAIRTFKFTKDD